MAEAHIFENIEFFDALSISKLDLNSLSGSNLTLLRKH